MTEQQEPVALPTARHRRRPSRRTVAFGMLAVVAVLLIGAGVTSVLVGSSQPRRHPTVVGRPSPPPSPKPSPSAARSAGRMKLRKPPSSSPAPAQARAVPPPARPKPSPHPTHTSPKQPQPQPPSGPPGLLCKLGILCRRHGHHGRR